MCFNDKMKIEWPRGNVQASLTACNTEEGGLVSLSLSCTFIFSRSVDSSHLVAELLPDGTTVQSRRDEIHVAYRKLSSPLGKI